MSKKMKTLFLCLGGAVLLAAVLAGVWYFALREKPLQGGNVLNIDWYDENGTEFTIETIEQFREFAELSDYYTFEGQTIKLGADLTDNEGDAADWEKEIPEHVWKPIGNFAGNFDGQGHTISGICGYAFVYIAQDAGEIIREPTGLFRHTKADCIIKDFRLVNSFFFSDFNEGVGSISSDGGGTFDSIYSSAIVLTYKENAGGIVGMLDVRGDHTITNCWFDGVLRIEGNFGRYAGGIVGRIKDTGGQNLIEHCLNTGTLSSTVEGRGINLAGIVGNVSPQGRVTLEDCLNTGSVSNEYGIAAGSVIGLIQTNASATITNVYTTLDSYDKVVGTVQGDAHGLPMEYDRAMLTGYGGYQWTSLDFDEYWAVVEDGTPTLQYFTEKIPSVAGLQKNFDTSWYNRVDSEFVISTREQLYGLAIVSRSTDFSEKTVKLGADIVINAGEAKDWATVAPELTWVPISTVSYPFAGTFDGQGHSISGVYFKAASPYSGLFSTTADEATIRNLRLENSYFSSDAASFGSVAGRGRGTFDTIYSSAIVEGTKTNLGGMIGQIPSQSKIAVTNCWFAGSVTHLGNSLSDRRCGGIIGVMYSSVTVENCLNSGTIDTTNYTTPNANNKSIIVPLSGGLVGYVGKETQLTLRSCLNTGSIKVNPAATAGYGSVVGYVDGAICVESVYGTKESSDKHAVRNSVAGEVAAVSTGDISGYGAYQRTLLDFVEHWAVVKGDTPVLQPFAKEIPSLSGVAKLYDIGWYNAGGSVYRLDSKEDLYGFSLLSYNTDFSKKTVKLGADITVNSGEASGWAKNIPAYTWTPVGSNTYPFAGTFDGQMHTISGIYMKADTQYTGLFGVTTDESTIKNLKLINSYFETSEYSIGSIAGRGRGTFDTIYSDAVVFSTTGNVGGIVGQVPAESKIKINNCWFDGKVTCSGNSFSDRRIGGIVGVAYSDFTISNCLNSGTIDASKYTTPNANNASIIVPLAGGIIGTDAKNVVSTISNCLHTGKVLVSSVTTAGYGAMAGYREGTMTLERAYATPDSCTSFTGSRLNGLITVVDNAKLKGYGGYQWTLLDFNTYWAVVTDDTPVLQSFAKTIPSLSGVSRMIGFAWRDATQGTKNDPYVLKDAADLYGLAALSVEDDFAGKYFRLDADIILNSGNAGDWSNMAPSYTWTPIGSQTLPFAGVLDGQNHTVSGLYLNTADRWVGLFSATAESAEIRNLKLKNSYIKTTAADVGSIAGIGRGTFDTVYSDAIIDCAGARSGGLLGQASGADTVVKNCWFAGSITNSGANVQATGGLVGIVLNNAKLTMTSCLHSGTVDVSAVVYQPYAGGLVGQVGQGGSGVLVLNDALVTGLLKTNASITAGYGAGVGMVSNKANSTIANVYFTPEVSNRSISVASGSTYKGLPAKTGGSIVGEAARTTMPNLAWDTAWQTVTGNIPVLRPFADEMPEMPEEPITPEEPETPDEPETPEEPSVDTSWLSASQGTQEDPYIIADAGDFYGLAALAAENDFAGKYFRLAADIDLNSGEAADWGETAPANVWTPIGKQTLPFAGVFDGQNHTVSGLYLNTADRWVGLFSATAESAEVRNLKLTNSYIKTTAADVGSIAGIGRGTFDTVYSDAIIDCAGDRSGGLLGQAAGADTVMAKCWFAGTITNSSVSSTAIGGLVGVVLNDAKLTATSCLVSGTVDVSARTSGQPYAGGLIGRVGMGSSGTLILSDSLVTGTLKTNASITAGYGAGVGMVSNKANSTIANVYFTPEVSNRSISVATGGTYSGVPAKTKDSITGEAARTTMPNLAWDTAWQMVEDGDPILIGFEETAVEKPVVPDTSWLDNAQGTQENPYIIADAGDLYGLATLAAENDFAGKYFRLDADIVLNSGNAADWRETAPANVWTPIGKQTLPFAGVLDGQNHTISGLYINTSDRWVGLFSATADSAEIRNLKLTNSYIKTTAADVGSIVGVGRGTFDTVYSDAIIDCAGARSGGLLGQVSGADTVMTNCWFAGTITNSGTGAQGTGGLAGIVLNTTTLTMTSCHNSGTVDVSACTKQPFAGGLVGQVGQGGGGTLILSDSLITGTLKTNPSITAGYGAGVGMVSNRASSTIANVYFTPEVSNRSISVATGSTYSGVPAKTSGSMLGEAARTTMPKLAWDTAWVTVEDSYPVLKAFADEK